MKNTENNNMLKQVSFTNKKTKTYWDIVWKQFKKRKAAVISAWIIALFFFIAIFAPFLANDKPLIIYTTYGEFYQYELASLHKNHMNYVQGMTNRINYISEQKIAQKKFDTLKQEIHLLNKENDKLGNQYDKIINQIKESIDKAKQKNKENDKPGNKYDKIINQIIKSYLLDKDKPKKAKSLLEKERDQVGANQQSLKRKMYKKHSEQQEVNIRLTQLKHQLNYKKNAQLILDSLNSLNFPVSSKIQDKIEIIIGRYESLFSKYNKLVDRGDLTQLTNSPILKNLNDIFYTVKKDLSYSVIKNKLVKKHIFPAISSLTILDIIFMSSFLFLISLPFINRILARFSIDGRRKNQIIYFIFLGVITISVIFYLSFRPNRVVPTNYKMVLENIFNPKANDNLKTDKDRYLISKDDYAIFPPIPFGYNENFVEEKYQKPAILGFFSSQQYGRHLLGTDSTGRDVLSRMIWGARVSLSVGFVAVSIYVLIGIIVGAIAGYFGGWIDMTLSRIIEIVICFPSFFLILTIIAFVGPSILNIMIVIGLTSWTGIARLVRGEFLKLRNQDFVAGAISLGASHFKVIFRHILPNALTPVLVSATFGIASAMLIEAGLSFLGFGVREPNPSWGQMISRGQSDVLNYWWLSLIPGFAIFISVTVYNLVGDALREAIDPRLRE